jgi:hypothetical protein
MADPSWLAYLKEWPGLLIAGFSLWILGKVMFRLIDFSLGLLRESTEQRVLLTEAISLLRQLCQRNKGGG